MLRNVKIYNLRWIIKKIKVKQSKQKASNLVYTWERYPLKLFCAYFNDPQKFLNNKCIH